MGIGVSLFLAAVGAILAFAINADVEGVSFDVMGYVLMAVGGLGLLYTLFLVGDDESRHRHGHRGRSTGHQHYYEDDSLL